MQTATLWSDLNSMADGGVGEWWFEKRVRLLQSDLDGIRSGGCYDLRDS
jgi:hypothetical protein